jgi:hypothetical protein
MGAVFVPYGTVCNNDVVLPSGKENGLKFEQTCSSKLAIPKATFTLDMCCPKVLGRDSNGRCHATIQEAEHPSSKTMWS